MFCLFNYLCIFVSTKAKNMTQTITVSDLKVGMKIQFTCDTPEYNSVFEIAKIGDKNISWYCFAHKGGTGKNNLKMSFVSKKAFQRGLDSGAYSLA